MTVAIDRLRADLGVPEGSPEHRRLDGVLHRMLDSALEREIERAGLGSGGEEVCVRALRVPARLALDANADAVLAEQWARAIATGLAAAAGSGGPGVVRYGSRRQALTDFALAVAGAGGRLERAWAWRQLGLWPAGETRAVDALVAALLAEPRAIVAVLAAVARAGALPPFAPTAWARLAAAALEAAGAPPAACRAVLDAPEAGAGASLARDIVPERLAGALRRALAGSAIVARAATTAPVASAATAPPAALAALALAECEPALLATERAAQALEAMALALASRTPGPTAIEPAPSRETSIPPPPERDDARTRWGGLAFVLHALEPLELPERFAELDLPAALHALALRLVPAEPDDPAALLLAGLAPAADPPDPYWVEPPPEIAAAALAVHIWLAERLEIDPVELDRHALLRREARIVADPGWIEVHLLAEEVDVDVRRAGLDFDPDWVPALGCVVRIVYA